MPLKFPFFLRCWISPIGKSIGIKSTKAKPPVPNKTLESAYNSSPKLVHKTVMKIFSTLTYLVWSFLIQLHTKQKLSQFSTSFENVNGHSFFWISNSRIMFDLHAVKWDCEWVRIIFIHQWKWRFYLYLVGLESRCLFRRRDFGSVLLLYTDVFISSWSFIFDFIFSQKLIIFQLI